MGPFAAAPVKNGLRGRMKLEDFPTSIPVVALALIDGRGRVLMQRRRKSSMHGGLWEFPGGKVEQGETATAALVREIDEELGIGLPVNNLREVGRADSRDMPPGETSTVSITLFASHSWQGQPQCLDGEEIAWIAAGDLLRLAMPPLDYPLARQLLAFIGQDAK